ncbi:hypothetical protein CW745_08235 [Psychromonas sp. psych-6C06]|uniref:hypothetical protein n=1 Tax=Psychromonas sp. psych-6C06 TaxID=2058089 RepID=UPI000C341121|nr:hypothetical protein [Psychromonas sp. psych-6C06]PKF61965.1 hypothetical protein CW745_08235 [Psychromonas sp. psych-6C06]
MKKILFITLALLSTSVFATGSSQSNAGLNGDLIQKATAAGLSTNEAVQGVATGKITYDSIAKIAAENNK